MKEILRVEHLMKVYPNGVMANKDINFSANKGEIHAICGENGAGKSTLMKMLYGMEQPSGGKIFINGKEVFLTSSATAIENSIGMVHQHFMLVPSLTVAENVVLGVEPKKGLSFDLDAAIQQTEKIAKKYNLNVPTSAKVNDIAVGVKQRVEIIKALLRGAEILILDEPTTVLTPQETEELFAELKQLKEQGHTILFISHKLTEVKQLCDRVTVMRNGRMIGTKNIEDVTEVDISRMMVGRDVVDVIEKTQAQPKEIILEVKKAVYKNSFGKKILNDVSFCVKKGQILGVAGVEGNGQHDILEAISGSIKLDSGEILLKNTNICRKSIREIRKMNVAHIPEDRMVDGCAKNLSITQNILAGKQGSKEFTGKVLLKQRKLCETTDTLIKDYLVKCSNQNQEIGMLSGGNIQKVVVAREFSSNPDIILVDQPTRGIDVGAAEFIRNKLISLRDEGKAIILNSADLNEVLGLPDSLIVFCEGKIVGYIEDTASLTEEELGLYMLGVKKQDESDIIRRMYA